MSTMLIVTESINADREPNKTHNEPSTARELLPPAITLAEMETEIREAFLIPSIIVSDKFRVTASIWS